MYPGTKLPLAQKYRCNTVNYSQVLGGGTKKEMKIKTGWKSVSGFVMPKEYGNGAPLQYSCLENPMDGGAW